MSVTRGFQNEVELRDSQARLAGIIDSAMDAIVTVDDRQSIVVFNRAAERMFLCSAKEAIGHSIDRFIPERFRLIHSSHIKAFGQEGVTTRVMAGARPVHGLRTNGEEFPVEASISQVETGGRKLFTVIMRDISERERAEERFRQLFEAAPNGMVMVDQNGSVVLVNAEIERAFGYSRSELLGCSIEKLLPKRFRKSHPAFRDSFTANPSVRPMGAGRDLYGLRKDGTEFPVEVGLNPLRTEQGMMFLGTVVDITERKRTEESLRHSQQQLAGIIGSAMDAIISVDEEHRIVLFNEAAEKMFLYSSSEAIGQDLGRFIPERFRASHSSHISEFGRTRVTRRSMGSLGSLFGLRSDGEEFPIEASISQLEVDGRKIFTVILRDISKRKRAEEAINEQARILDLAPVLIRDLKGRILFWNSGAEQMYGWTSDQAVGQLTHVLFKTEFPQPLENIKATLFASGHWEGELKNTRRDGRQIVVASHWVLHKTEADEPKAILEVNNDITARRVAEERIVRLATAVEQSGDSIMITDTKGNIQYVNPAFEKTTGYSKDEVIGQNPRILKSGIADAACYKELWTTITSGNQWNGHFTNRKKDGSLFEEEVTISPVHDDKGTVVSFVAVKRDVTERLRAEREIHRLNEDLERRVIERTAQLEAANKELEAFSYSVSHDLRAPLRHINGFSQALLEDYTDRLDDVGRGYLGQLREASQEMAQLIDDLLQLARVSRSEMRQEVVNLSEEVRAVASELQKRDPDRRVHFEIQEGVTAFGDKRLLRIVLINLLGNAWKFTSKKARAEITFGRELENGEEFYFVRDNGAGFDMNYVDKLFRAFQRLHSGDEFEGTGIGLATVMRIVSRHRGRVRASGIVNEGATFYFTLPRETAYDKKNEE